MSFTIQTQRDAGLSMIELLLVMAILAIIVAVAVPNISHIVQRSYLNEIANQLHSHLQLAKSEALKSNQPVTVSFGQQQSQWCYGISNSQSETACDCFAPDSCLLNKQNYTVKQDVNKVELLSANFAGGDGFTGFEPLRMTAIVYGSSRNGSIWLTNQQGEMKAVVVSRMGRIRICEQGETGCPNPPSL